MNKRLLKNIEWGILICTILLIVIGFVALFSATQNAGYDEFKKQIMWVLVSIPVMIVVILIDYEIFIKISPVLYGASLIFLIGVFIKNIFFKYKNKIDINSDNDLKLEGNNLNE